MRDALAARCRALHLPVDRRIDRAIEEVFRPRPKVSTLEFRETRESPAFGRLEAVEILRNLKAYPSPMRSMPEVGALTPHEAKRSTEPFGIDCQFCGPSQGRRSWSVANWVLCLTCRKWNEPLRTRALDLTREAETTQDSHTIRTKRQISR